MVLKGRVRLVDLYLTVTINRSKSWHVDHFLLAYSVLGWSHFCRQRFLRVWKADREIKEDRAPPGGNGREFPQGQTIPSIQGM